MDTLDTLINLQPHGDFSLLQLSGEARGAELFGRIERILLDKPHGLLIVHLESAWEVAAEGGKMTPSDRLRLTFATGITLFEEAPVDSGRCFVSENERRSVSIFTERIRLQNT